MPGPSLTHANILKTSTLIEKLSNTREKINKSSNSNKMSKRKYRITKDGIKRHKPEEFYKKPEDRSWTFPAQ